MSAAFVTAWSPGSDREHVAKHHLATVGQLLLLLALTCVVVGTVCAALVLAVVELLSTGLH
jgi:hypothetical protein